MPSSGSRALTRSRLNAAHVHGGGGGQPGAGEIWGDDSGDFMDGRIRPERLGGQLDGTSESQQLLHWRRSGHRSWPSMRVCCSPLTPRTSCSTHSKRPSITCLQKAFVAPRNVYCSPSCTLSMHLSYALLLRVFRHFTPRGAKRTTPSRRGTFR